MRRERDVAVVVADFQIGMMILDVRDMRERVHEAHGAIEISELERALEALRAGAEFPIRVKLGAQRRGLRLRQRRAPALAGRTLLGGESARGWGVPGEPAHACLA